MCAIVSAHPSWAAWRATGPYGGSADIIRTFPDKQNAVLAATSSGLLFSSLNGGASWDSVPFPARGAGTLHALEIDPHSGSTWYAGIEANVASASGVYRTTDAGRKWTLLPGTAGLAVWSIAFAPSDTATIAAGTGSGVYLSPDHGGSWKLISRPNDPELRPVVSLAFDPGDKRTLYAGTTHLPWRTADGGATWESIHEGMIDDSDVFSIQVDAREHARVLASACSGAYSSGDGARHWTRLDTPKGAFRTYFIALDPANPRDIFAGTSSGLIKSSNGGATWRKISQIAVKSIAFDRFVAGRIFFASTDAGLLVSTDNGDTVRQTNAGFTNRALTGMTGAGDILYVTGGGPVFRTESLGLRWDRAGDYTSGALLTLAVDPNNPRRLFGAGYRGLVESSDAGRTWRDMPGPADGARVKALQARKGTVLLAGTDRGLYRRTGAQPWKRVSTGAIEWLGQGAAATALTGNSAMVSTDDGATWRECSRSAADITLYGVTVDAVEVRIALAATSRGLLRSTDACRSWTLAGGGLEQATVEAVLFHPTRGGEAYAAQGGKVFRSNDGGVTWRALASDGADLWPSALFISASAPDRLFALVPGRGVFSTITFAQRADFGAVHSRNSELSTGGIWSTYRVYENFDTGGQ